MAVIDPEIRRSVVELDMVRDVEIAGGDVTVGLALTVAGCPMKSNLEDQVRRHVGAVDGVGSVAVALRRDDAPSSARRCASSCTATRRRASGERRIALHPRTRVVAVASGKGGVGKSTLTANLAASLAAGGAEVGVIDADIYGYSIPRMLGVSRKPVVVDKMIVPPVDHELKVMSIGFFADPDAAVVWRGPMLHRALEQFLSDVHWGELDYLVVDMPPGTGDVSISLGQLLPQPDLVIVTTPQPAAQKVAAGRRGGGQDGHAGGRRRREHEPPGLLLLRRDHAAVRRGRRPRRWRTSWACRCSARCRWTSRCGSPPMRGTPLVISHPDAASSRPSSSLPMAPGVLRPLPAAVRIRKPLAVSS